MEEEDDAESLKELQENIKCLSLECHHLANQDNINCFKVIENTFEAIFMFLTLLFFINYYISASVRAIQSTKTSE